MPAGDLVIADNQLELRTVLSGFGTSFPIAFENLSGLGVPEAKTSDIEFGHAPGAYLGRDYSEVRIITVPYVLRGTPLSVGANFRTLCVMWAVSETNLPLHARLPGLGKFTVTGRPRGLVDDLTQLNIGVVRALATFVCGDPTITFL
ncbi:MAG: hypothetical protein WKF86_00165 [Acidimicrobiales bacterium]